VDAQLRAEQQPAEARRLARLHRQREIERRQCRERREHPRAERTRALEAESERRGERREDGGEPDHGERYMSAAMCCAMASGLPGAAAKSPAPSAMSAVTTG